MKRLMMGIPHPPGADLDASSGPAGCTGGCGRCAREDCGVVRPRTDRPSCWPVPGPAWPWLPLPQDSQSAVTGASRGPRHRRPVRFGAMGPRVLVIDNYDSFVYNLVQELGELGADPVVYRNDEIDIAGIRAASPDAILISPGPGRPEHAGISQEVVGNWGRTTRFWACASATSPSVRFSAARWSSAPTLMHGKTSAIHHNGTGVFAGLPDPFVATRYHSLVVEPSTLPDVLEVTATTADGVIMGFRHRQLPIEGVQFHPESILTPSGPSLLANFLASPPASDRRARGSPRRRLQTGTSHAPLASMRLGAVVVVEVVGGRGGIVVVGVVVVDVVVGGGGPVETIGVTPGRGWPKPRHPDPTR